MEVLKYLLVIAAGYLLGSISVSVCLSVGMGRDVRKEGSGNAGATNMARVFGMKAGVITLLGDMVKAALAVLLGYLLLGDMGLMAGGIACIVGHCFPVFHQFKGGKGVATGLGVLVFLMPKVAGTVFLVWLVLVLLTRYVSLGSIVAAISTPLAAWYYCYPVAYVILGAIAGFFVVLRHKENIGRLLSGTESKIKPGNAKNLSK